MSAALAASIVLALALPAPPITIEGEDAVRRSGGAVEAIEGASAGVPLAGGFGAAAGDFAEYDFEVGRPIDDARVVLRYARAMPGGARFSVAIGGRPPVEIVLAGPTGGFARVAVPVGRIERGPASLRIERPAPRTMTFDDDVDDAPFPDPLALLGSRADKGTLGGGAQVAAFARANPQVSFATNSLGDVFGPLRGTVESWRPDRVLVVADASSGDIALDSIEIDSPSGVAAPPAQAPRRFEIALAENDVLLARTEIRAGERVVVAGDFSGSREWRGKPGSKKTVVTDATGVTVTDEDVYPAVVARIGAALPPASAGSPRAGAYAIEYDRPGTLVVGCALARDERAARSSLERALASKPDPLEAVSRSWREWFSSAVPRFDCTDRRLAELWWFRFYLLRTATCGGDMGLFRKRVVLEGRDAYQTFCCYSAPFLARDLAWAKDGSWGAGSIETLAENAYEDGRLPWYTSPRTTEVPVHHASATGVSFLAAAAWDHYLVHRDRAFLDAVFPPLARNLDWWLRERTRGGLVTIDDLLETGMDDLARSGSVPLPAVDASCVTALNARALAAMAREIGRAEDAARIKAAEDEIARAVRDRLFDRERGFFFDDGEKTRVRTIAGFYPFFAGIAAKEHARALDALFDERAFAAPYPIPALARDEKGFDPRSFWMGPSWPAATCHALEGAAQAAKTLDRSRREAVGALLMRAVNVLFSPRIDFYERYDPLSGEGLSSFRDYMHSWWIDLVVRHVIGLEPRADGEIVLDPLPVAVDAFRVVDLGCAGRRLEVSWQRAGAPRRYADRPLGFSLSVDGRLVAERNDRERISYNPERKEASR